MGVGLDLSTVLTQLGQRALDVLVLAQEVLVTQSHW